MIVEKIRVEKVGMGETVDLEKSRYLLFYREQKLPPWNFEIKDIFCNDFQTMVKTAQNTFGKEYFDIWKK